MEKVGQGKNRRRIGIRTAAWGYLAKTLSDSYIQAVLQRETASINPSSDSSRRRGIGVPAPAAGPCIARCVYLADDFAPRRHRRVSQCQDRALPFCILWGIVYRVDARRQRNTAKSSCIAWRWLVNHTVRHEKRVEQKIRSGCNNGVSATKMGEGKKRQPPILQTKSNVITRKILSSPSEGQSETLIPRIGPRAFDQEKVSYHYLPAGVFSPLPAWDSGCDSHCGSSSPCHATIGTD